VTLNQVHAMRLSKISFNHPIKVIKDNTIPKWNADWGSGNSHWFLLLASATQKPQINWNLFLALAPFLDSEGTNLFPDNAFERFRHSRYKEGAQQIQRKGMQKVDLKLLGAPRNLSICRERFCTNRTFGHDNWHYLTTYCLMRYDYGYWTYEKNNCARFLHLLCQKPRASARDAKGFRK